VRSREGDREGDTVTRTAQYTHGHHEAVLRAHRWRTAANSAGYLLGHLRPGMSLLDVGCGPGTITADLAGLVAPGPVTAVENAPEVLEAARREAAHTSVSFLATDAHALGLASGAFDVVHAHQVLQHVADPVQVLREMRRVCAPTGVVAVRDSDYGAFTWYPAVPELDDWLALYQRLARTNGGEPDAGRRLLGWCRQAGFREVTPSCAAWCFGTPQDREWWGHLWAERVTDSRFAEQALSSGLAGRADLERIARGWWAWAAAPDGWMSILHGEVLARP
jgi:ubiquinone/menaquinone biosynthesis C-methylase UbiE